MESFKDRKAVNSGTLLRFQHLGAKEVQKQTQLQSDIEACQGYLGLYLKQTKISKSKQNLRVVAVGLCMSILLVMKAGMIDLSLLKIHLNIQMINQNYYASLSPSLSFKSHTIDIFRSQIGQERHGPILSMILYKLQVHKSLRVFEENYQMCTKMYNKESITK